MNFRICNTHQWLQNFRILSSWAICVESGILPIKKFLVNLYRPPLCLSLQDHWQSFKRAWIQFSWGSNVYIIHGHLPPSLETQVTALQSNLLSVKPLIGYGLLGSSNQWDYSTMVHSQQNPIASTLPCHVSSFLHSTHNSSLTDYRTIKGWIEEISAKVQKGSL